MCQLHTQHYNLIFRMCHNLRKRCHNSLPSLVGDNNLYSPPMQGACNTNTQPTACAVCLLHCYDLQMFRHRDCLTEAQNTSSLRYNNILLISYCNKYSLVKNANAVAILYKTLLIKLSHCPLIGKRETNIQTQSRQFKYTSMCSDP